MSAAWVSFVAKRVGAKSWLHVQDFEVDAAFDLGLLHSDFLRKLMLKAEVTILKSFDRVSTISPEMLLRLQKKGVAREKTAEIRNWIDTRAIIPSPRTTRYRKELNLRESDIVALYSGTMSNKQGLDLVVEAAMQLEGSHPHIYFILAGEGPDKARLAEMAAGHSNIFFLGLQPNQSFNELMATADFHLIPQRAEAADLVLPSKLGAIFSSARPVIAMAREDTGLAAEVRGAGFVVAPGDAHALAAALCRLSQDPALCHELGTQGRKRAIERWDRRTIVRNWAHAMSTMHGSSTEEDVTAPFAAEGAVCAAEDVGSA
jgi:colanic acid biosynthesis glycosyl transferase WcaI